MIKVPVELRELFSQRNNTDAVVRRMSVAVRINHWRSLQQEARHHEALRIGPTSVYGRMSGALDALVEQDG